MVLAAHRDERFFAGTKGQIVTLLRRSGRTVDDTWCRAVGLTGSGVRARPAALERDGIVRQRGVVRRGSGKPAPRCCLEVVPDHSVGCDPGR